mgnify:FL=1
MGMVEVFEQMGTNLSDHVDNPVNKLQRGNIKKYTDGSKWVICPYCGKKNIRVYPKTWIKMLPWKCKGSNCRKDFLVDV